jgi:4-hydroxybenzoate polyprenyltransferase
MKLSVLWKHSRPRFWHYLYGPMLVWWAYYFKVNIPDIWYDWFVFYAAVFFFIAFILYFTFPANLFVYWINDYADWDTDKFNDKKQGYEGILKKEKNFLLNVFLIQIFYRFILAVLYFIWFIIYQNIFGFDSIIQYLYDFWNIFIRSVLLVVLPFGILSWFYSVEPIRFKKRIFIDGISNVLYIITPTILIGLMQWYSSFGDITPAFWMWFGAAWFWCIAMHCFSAIPDIDADKKAWLNTTAIFLWKKWSLIYCAILYLLAGIMSYFVIGILWIVLWLIYFVVVMLGFEYDIFTIYKRFPYVNFVIWWLLCFAVYFI